MKRQLLTLLFIFCLATIKSQEVTTLDSLNVVTEVNDANVQQAAKVYKAATKKVKRNDIQGAIAEYETAISLNPRYVDAYKGLANVYLNKSNYDMAIVYFSKALSLDTLNSDIIRNLSFAYVHRGADKCDAEDFPGAVSDYTKALEYNPKDAVLYDDLGAVYLKMGNYDSALKNFDVSLSIQPGYESALLNKAQAYRSMGQKKFERSDYRGAVSDYEGALIFNPKDDEIYNQLALSFIKLGDFDNAILFLDKGMSVNPGSKAIKETRPWIYFNRGLKKSDSGDPEGAVSDFKQAIQLNPLFLDAYAEIDSTYKKLGKADSALIYQEKALEAKGKINAKVEAEVYLLQGLDKFNAGNYQGSIREYTKALELYPNYAEAYNNIGVSYYHLGKYSKAIKYYKQALRIDPNYTIAKQNMEDAHQAKSEKTGEFVGSIIEAIINGVIDGVLEGDE